MSTYDVEGAFVELTQNIVTLKELVTHPLISHTVRNYIQDALDALSDASEMMMLEEEGLSSDEDYLGSWTDADTARKADGTFHLKPVLTVNALNKALALARSPDFEDDKWFYRASKRLNPPKGVVREVLTLTKHIKFAPSDFNALALAGGVM